MKKSKIDWTDCTVNPVVGCQRGCEYCYAKKLNDRFKWVEDFAKPKFYPERLQQFDDKNPRSVFIDSMSDICFWDYDWLEETIKAISKNPQHRYIALTKGDTSELFTRINYIRHRNNLNKILLYIGKTITTIDQLDKYLLNGEYADFLSIEPILESLDVRSVLHTTHFIIIGAETGNRKDKVVPKRKWIENIVKECDEANVGVFMKESLRDIMGGKFRQDNLLWSVNG